MSPKEEPAPNVGVATVLSAGTRAVGELHSKEDLVLIGSFEGRLMVDHSLRIMPEARVDGEVHAERILVLGHTQGTLLAQQRIEIKPGAVVTGEVVAPQIRIHEGVILNARVHMSGTLAAPGTTAATTGSSASLGAGPAAAPGTFAAAVPAAKPAAVVAPAAFGATTAAHFPGTPSPAYGAVPSAPPPPIAPASPVAPPAPMARPAPVPAPEATPEARSTWGWGGRPAAPPAPALGPPRHYLLPALLRSMGDAPNEDIEHAERATENFLRGLGFELETRAAKPDRTGSLRPIFRSAEPLPYATLRERLQRLEQALRVAASEGAEPLQGTGTAHAREVATALARLRRAALVVGPVALVRQDENPGDLHLSVRVRRPLPEPSATDNPDPASLLVSLQKMQHELLDDLG